MSTADADQAGPSGYKSYKRVFKYATGTSWILYCVSFAAAIGAGAALPLMNLVFGKFVTVFNNFAMGTVQKDEYMDNVRTYCMYFIYLFLAKFFLVYIHAVAASMAAIQTTKALRVEFLQSLLRQDTSYFDSKETGSPSAKITTNGNLVTNGISERLTTFMQSTSTFVVAFVVAFWVQWKLTLITICIVPALVVITGVCMTIEVKNENQLVQIVAHANMIAEEVFSSISTIHAFWLQPFMAQRYENVLDQLRRVGMKKSPNYGVLFSSEFFCVYCGYALSFWQGIRMYARGEVANPGDIVTVISTIVVAATSLTHIAPQIVTIARSAAAADELFRIIDQDSAIDSLSSKGLRPDTCVGNILVKDVHFAYPSRPDAPVLNGMNLVVPAGKTTALVGASGSGKSTIVGLLERWYDHTDGHILLDGTDIKQLHIGWLRTRIRLVQQEPVLFSGTIFTNVAYGLVGTPYECAAYETQLALVQAACRDAYAHEFIESLPHKYETQVGESARMLSGGQKQRIAIARSIISRPAVLLLDEATSALDPKAEILVQRALDHISVGRTTITIAHRLSTIQKADNIVVMAYGRVVEQGTHSDLLARDGAYARLVRAQNLEKAQGAARAEQDSISPVEDDDDDDDDDDDAEGKGAGAGAKSKKAKDDNIAQRYVRGRADVEQSDRESNQGPEHETMGYGLLRSLYLLVKEQPKLWGLYILLICMCILGGLTTPTHAIILAHVLEIFLKRGDEAVHDGDFWALMFFDVALVSFVLYFVLGWIANTIIQKISHGYRRELFQNTMKQDLGFFDLAHNSTGAICSRLLETAANLNELLGINFGLILINLTTVVSVAALAILSGWKLGLVCVFGALPPFLLSGYFRVVLENRLQDATAGRFASSASVAAEAVAAIRTVSSLTLETKMVALYQARLDAVARQSVDALTSTMFWYALSQCVNLLAMALGFYYGGQLVATHEYTTKQFFVVFLAVMVGGENAAAVFQFTTSITKATGSANYIFWLRRRVPAVHNCFASHSESFQPPPPTDSVSSPRRAVSVDCHALSFAYPSRPRQNVVRGIDLTIRPGQFVALVGPSGCGKSTMISLLCRFYNPTAGCIAVDGQPIHDIAPQTHRRRLALVKQEPVLYQGSIRDNIAMGLAESSAGRGNGLVAAAATDAQIEQACRDANILDFVSSLPEGLDTDVGARGSRLSGGQRQRVAIARALVRQPQVLLLDEATSALDTESEKMVQAALTKAAGTRQRSTIAVAHRLSTVKDADCIFVFQAGHIVEKGHHAELYAKRGIYYEMCKGQALDAAMG